jgi:hypothetical protein
MSPNGRPLSGLKEYILVHFDSATSRCQIPLLQGKSKGYDAKTQYRSTQVMVVNERDIFNLSAQLGQSGIIDNKIDILP